MLDGGAFGRGWRGSNEGARGSEGWAGEQGAPCFRVAASGLIDAWKYCESVFCTRHALSTVSTLGGFRQGAVRVDVVMAEAAPAAKDSMAMATVAVVPGEAEKAAEARAVVVMAAEERWRYWEWRHISHRIHDSLRRSKMPCARVSGRS